MSESEFEIYGVTFVEKYDEENTCGEMQLKNRILWFSRHEMTPEQKSDLFRIYGPAEIVQISKPIQNAYELKDDIEKCNVIAVVAPTNLQEQFLKIADKKPVISCRNKRVLLQDENGGESKVQFVFDGWFQIDEVRVITHDL